MELVFEKIKYAKDEELLWYNKIMFVECTPIKIKKKLKRYVVCYLGMQKNTIIYAQNMEWYRSTPCIREISKEAVAAWNKRRICLPSVMTAIMLLEQENRENSISEIKERVQAYTDSLAFWKNGEAAEKKEKIRPWGEDNYILAAQHFQESFQACCEQGFETLLIRTIEENKLARFDG